MTDQFTRTRLLLGEEAFHALQQAHVAIVGCGAVGSFAAEALARAGVGQLTLIDGDTVEESNINRQLFAVHSSLGQPKTEAARHRLHDINPNLNISSNNFFLDDKTCASLLEKRPDFVLDAIDTLAAKEALILYLLAEKIPFAASMGAALRTDPSHVQEALFHQTNVCPLAAHLRKNLRKKLGKVPSFPVVYSDEPPKKASFQSRQLGSLITLTGVFGLRLAHIALRFLTEQSEGDKNGHF